MANRRQLKKTINYVCGELLAECVAAKHYNTNVNPEDLDNVMLSILSMQDDLIRRLSHVEPGSTKLFFRKLNADLYQQTEAIIQQIFQLV